MPYTPPSGDTLSIQFGEAYSSPTGDTLFVQFGIDQGSSVPYTTKRIQKAGKLNTGLTGTIHTIKLLALYIYAAASTPSSVFGTATVVGGGTLLVNGLDAHLASGSSNWFTVTNEFQEVHWANLELSGFTGLQTVQNQNNYIVGAGISDPWYGALMTGQYATVKNKNVTITMKSLAPSGLFGYVDAAFRRIWNAGGVSGEAPFGTATIANSTKEIKPDSIVSSEFYVIEAVNKNKFITASLRDWGLNATEINLSEFGSQTVNNVNQVVTPFSVLPVSSPFPSNRVETHGSGIYCDSILSEKIGAPWITLGTRYIAPLWNAVSWSVSDNAIVGTDQTISSVLLDRSYRYEPADFGIASAFNPTKFVQQSDALNGAALGVPWVSFGNRNLYPSSIVTDEINSGSWVSHSTRGIVAGGLKAEPDRDIEWGSTRIYDGTIRLNIGTVGTAVDPYWTAEDGVEARRSLTVMGSGHLVDNERKEIKASSVYPINISSEFAPSAQKVFNQVMTITPFGVNNSKVTGLADGSIAGLLVSHHDRTLQMNPFIFPTSIHVGAYGWPTVENYLLSEPNTDQFISEPYEMLDPNPDVLQAGTAKLNVIKDAGDVSDSRIGSPELWNGLISDAGNITHSNTLWIGYPVTSGALYIEPYTVGDTVFVSRPQYISPLTIWAWRTDDRPAQWEDDHLTAAIENHLSYGTYDLDPLALFGDPAIQNQHRTIVAKGEPLGVCLHTRFSSGHTISNVERFVYPASVNRSDTFGYPDIFGGDIAVEAYSISPPEEFSGMPTVSTTLDQINVLGLFYNNVGIQGSVQNFHRTIAVESCGDTWQEQAAGHPVPLGQNYWFEPYVGYEKPIISIGFNGFETGSDSETIVGLTPQTIVAEYSDPFTIMSGAYEYGSLGKVGMTVRLNDITPSSIYVRGGYFGRPRVIAGSAPQAEYVFTTGAMSCPVHWD